MPSDYWKFRALALAHKYLPATKFRPKGPGKSKLDDFKPEIEALLKNGSSKTFIAKRYKTSLPNFYKWMKKQRIPLKPADE